MLASRTSSAFAVLVEKKRIEQEEYVRKQRAEAVHIIEDCKKRLIAKRVVRNNG